MAKYLRVDPDADPATGGLTGANYRLPADTDVGELCENLAEAMAKGSSVSVEVEMSDDPTNRAVVIVNGNTVRSVLVGRTPEPDDAAFVPPGRELGS